MTFDNFEISSVKACKLFYFYKLKPFSIGFAAYGPMRLQPINVRLTRNKYKEAKSKSVFLKAAKYLAIPLHFIMERRTLMGIKERAEAGENIQLPQAKDILWFSGLVLSGILIFFLVFISRGIIQSTILPSIFSTCWLFSALQFKPIPLYSIGLLLAVFAATMFVS